FTLSRPHRQLHSFPTRRSSDLEAARAAGAVLVERFGGPVSGLRSKSSATDLVSEADERAEHTIVGYLRARRPDDGIIAEEGSEADRKSTRLNSSHRTISYAVFC